MTTDTTREGVPADQHAEKLRDAMVDKVIVRHQQQGLVLPGEVEAALRIAGQTSMASGGGTVSGCSYSDRTGKPVCCSRAGRSMNF